MFLRKFSRARRLACALLTIVLANSVALAAELELFTGHNFSLTRPKADVVEDGHGGFFAASTFRFEQTSPLPDFQRVRVTHVDAQGNATWGLSGIEIAEVLPDATIGPDMIDVDLTPDGSGGVYVSVSWIFGTNFVPVPDQSGLVVEHIAPNGVVTQLARSVLLENSAYEYGSLGVESVADGAGGVYVVIPLALTGTDGFGLYAVHYNLSGYIYSGLLTPYFGSGPGTVSLRRFAISSDGQGGLLAMYLASDGGPSRVYAQRLAANLTLWGQRGVEIWTPSTDVSDVLPLLDPASGNLFAIYVAQSVAYAQRLSATGIQMWGLGAVLLQDSGDPVLINVPTFLSAVPSGDGGFVLVHGRTEVKAQRVSATGALLWGSGQSVATRGMTYGGGEYWTLQRVVRVDANAFAVLYADRWLSTLHQTGAFLTLQTLDASDGTLQPGAQRLDGEFDGQGHVWSRAEWPQLFLGADNTLRGCYAHVLTGEPGMPGLTPHLAVFEVALDAGPVDGSIFEDVTAGDLAQANNGRGMSWVDYDLDGDLDLSIATTNQTAKLFLNQGGDDFADATPAGFASTAQSGYINLTLAADYDGDGDADALIGNRSAPKFVRNDGELLFTDASSQFSGLVDGYGLEGASWVDVNDDGYVDLYFNSAGPNRTKLGNGDGSFGSSQFLPVVSGPSGSDTYAAVWSDLDLDGDLDLFLGNENPGESDNLIRNDGGGVYVDVTSPAVAGTGSTRAAAWGDFDNDGDPDLYVANYGSADLLLRNDGAYTLNSLADADIAGATWTTHVSWADFDNDKDLDLLLGLSSGFRILRNDGSGVFVDITPTWLQTTSFTPLAAAWADYDGDGDLDFATSSTQGFKLIRNNLIAAGNKLESTHWLAVDLRGSTATPLPVGARVRVTAGGVTQTRELLYTAHTFGQLSARLHFGLGTASAADLVEIFWPDGTVTSLTQVPGDQVLVRTAAQPTSSGPALSNGLPRLLAPFPNPANPRTTILFELSAEAKIELTIYNAAGRRVRTLAHQATYAAGQHRLSWDGDDEFGAAVGSGIYFLRLSAPGAEQSRRIALVR